MCNSIAAQFIGHDLPGFAAMRSQQTPEEALSSSPIPFDLKKYIDHFSVLVNSRPQVVLLAIDPDEDFIDEEGVAIASVDSFQASGINGFELDTPKLDSFSTDGYAPLSQKIFDISMTEVDAKVQPNGIADDFKRESMAFLGIHPPILAIMASKFGSTILSIQPF